MKKPKKGIQLYTLRDHIQTAEDFDSTLARLSALGVRDVQISAIGDIPARTQKEILDRYGVSVCVTHKSFDRMRGDLDALMEEHRVIGCEAIGLGCAPDEFRGSEDKVREFIAVTAEIGAKMKEKGFGFHYHNHDFEFKKLDGSDRTMMDLLIEETDPGLFSFIPDLAWIHYAGADPIAVMKKISDRIKVLHFKDYDLDADGNRRFVSLGRGRVNLRECYRTACELEIPYIVYEQDCDWTDGDPFRATEESWAFLRELDASE